MYVGYAFTTRERMTQPERIRWAAAKHTATRGPVASIAVHPDEHASVDGLLVEPSRDVPRGAVYVVAGGAEW